MTYVGSISRLASLSNRIGVPIIAIGLPLLAWELLSAIYPSGSFLFPAPSSIARLIWSQLSFDNQNGELIGHVGYSLLRLLVGVALATIVGTIIGALIGFTQWGRMILRPLLSLFMPVPALAWTPIFLLLIGIDNRTTILIVLIAASFEIIVNVASGIDNMNRRLLWVADSMGATNMQKLTKVIIPGILPYLITGVKLGTGFAWRSLIAAEMLAAGSYGLGFMIYRASELLDMKTIYAGLVIIAFLGYVIENVLIGRVEAATTERWGIQVER